MTINDVKLVELPKFADPRGNLSFVEQNNHIPFEIKGLWRQMENFSTNSLALEFADTNYNSKDYVKNYDEYIKMRSNGEI